MIEMINDATKPSKVIAIATEKETSSSSLAIATDSYPNETLKMTPKQAPRTIIEAKLVKNLYLI